MDEKLLDYIERQLKKGFSKEEIVSMLNRAGYDLKLIELHFEHIAKKIIFKRISLYTIIIVIIVLITFVTFYFYKSEKSKFLTTESEIIEDIDEVIRNKFNLAKKYYTIRELDKSLKQFKDLTKLRYNNPIFHFYVGNIYCQKEDYTLAIEYYERAISLNNKNPFYYVAMARCLEKQGFHERALQLLNNSLYVNLNSTIPDENLI